MSGFDIISVVVAIIRDENGRILLVRKRDTESFMLPGGKTEKGESELGALARELREELNCEINHNSAHFLGVFQAPAANEPGYIVEASLYDVRIYDHMAPRGEVQEITWFDPVFPERLTLAPLVRDQVLPFLATMKRTVA